MLRACLVALPCITRCDPDARHGCRSPGTIHRLPSGRHAEPGDRTSYGATRNARVHRHRCRDPAGAGCVLRQPRRLLRRIPGRRSVRRPELCRRPPRLPAPQIRADRCRRGDCHVSGYVRISPRQSCPAVSRRRHRRGLPHNWNPRRQFDRRQSGYQHAWQPRSGTGPAARSRPGLRRRRRLRLRPVLRRHRPNGVSAVHESPDVYVSVRLGDGRPRRADRAASRTIDRVLCHAHERRRRAALDVDRFAGRTLPRVRVRPSTTGWKPRSAMAWLVDIS